MDGEGDVASVKRLTALGGPLLGDSHLEVSHWSTTVLAEVSLTLPCLGAWLKVWRDMALFLISTVKGMGPVATAMGGPSAAGASPAMRRPERRAQEAVGAWRLAMERRPTGALFSGRNGGCKHAADDAHACRAWGGACDLLPA